MFDIDKATDAAAALRLGDGVKAERRLARTLGTVDFDDAPARIAAHAQRDVEAEAAAGNRLDVEFAGVAQFHDDALPILLVQVRNRCFQRLASTGLRRIFPDFLLARLCHGDSPSVEFGAIWMSMPHSLAQMFLFCQPCFWTVVILTVCRPLL